MTDATALIGKTIGRAIAIELVLGEFIGAILNTQEDGAAVAQMLFAKARLILDGADDPYSPTVEGATAAIGSIEAYAMTTLDRQASPSI